MSTSRVVVGHLFACVFTNCMLMCVQRVYDEDVNVTDSKEAEKQPDDKVSYFRHWRCWHVLSVSSSAGLHKKLEADLAEIFRER